ncbi:MAG: DNA polymerase III subunit gamma/tau, partial [Saccharofermentanales bacterium]
MGHIALYREWRPRTFEEVVEQHFTVAALKQAVISGNIGHAYLFSGTRGTGKTTMAQIFSRAINCLSPEGGNPCNKCSVCTGILNGTL